MSTYQHRIEYLDPDNTHMFIVTNLAVVISGNTITFTDQDESTVILPLHRLLKVRRITVI